MEFLPFLLSFTAGIVAGHLACKYLSHRTAGAYIVRSPTAFREASEGWSFVRKLSCRGTAFSESPSQTTGLHLQMGSIEAKVADLVADLDELRQQVVHRHESDAESLQERMEVIFSAWSDALKVEISDRQDRVIQHGEAGVMAVDLKLQRLDDLTESLQAKFAALHTLSEEVHSLQAALREIEDKQHSQNMEKPDDKHVTAETVFSASTPAACPQAAPKKSPVKPGAQDVSKRAEWKSLKSR